MKSYRAEPIGHGWTIDSSVARARAQELKDAYEVVAPSIDTEARLLSGGNLQRLILAREISSEPGLMVAVQPTRGLDVGAIETVHKLLVRQRDGGTAILLISEDLDEILMLADSVAVIYEGRISEPVAADRADIAELGLLMTGSRDTPGRADRIEPEVSAHATRGRQLLPFAIHTERRLETPRGLGTVTTIGAVVVALVISAFLIWFVGGNPINAYAHIVRASLGSVGVLSDTLVKATPLILTGLACSVAFRMRLWNIGAEGQLMMGAWGASAVVLVGWLPEGTSGLIYIPLMMIAGLVGRRTVGRDRRLAPGSAQRQRDHHHAHARVRGREVARVLVVRTLERGRLPDVSPLPT